MTATRVLVVEDDAVIGMLLAEMLAGMGYEVCAIEGTEADAVSAAARCRPDVMIVDVWLGEGSGLAAVEEINRSGPVPHVFVSGDISGIRALRLDSIAIQKPYRESDLARVIQQALAGAHPALVAARGHNAASRRGPGAVRNEAVPGEGSEGASDPTPAAGPPRRRKPVCYQQRVCVWPGME